MCPKSAGLCSVIPTTLGWEFFSHQWEKEEVNKTSMIADLLIYNPREMSVSRDI